MVSRMRRSTPVEDGEDEEAPGLGTRRCRALGP